MNKRRGVYSRIVAALTAVMLAAASGAAAQTAPNPVPEFDLWGGFESFQQRIIELATGRDGKLAAEFELESVDHVDGAVVTRKHDLVKLWWGNTPLLALSPKSFRFGFSRIDPAKKSGAEDAVENYEVTLRVERKALVVQHSEPRMKKQRGGVQFSSGYDRVRYAFIEGRGKTGVLFAVPDGTTDNAFGGLLCPRDFMSAGPQGDLVLSPNGFQPETVSAHPAGKIEGRVLTGIKVGRALAWIDGDPAFPAGRPARDEARGITPRVELTYIPEDDAAPFKLPPDALNVQRLKVHLELELPSGHRRLSERTLVLAIKRVEVPQFAIALSRGTIEASSMSALLPSIERRIMTGKGIPVKVTKGDCYVIAVAVTPIHYHYSVDRTETPAPESATPSNP